MDWMEMKFRENMGYSVFQLYQKSIANVIYIYSSVDRSGNSALAAGGVAWSARSCSTPPGSGNTSKGLPRDD